MAINFNEELIRVDYVIGEDTVSETVTGKIEVPDVKPDIQRVIEVTGTINSIETEVEEGGVNVSGIIETGVIYVADIEDPDAPQQPVHFTEGQIQFSNFIDIPEAEEGMNVFSDINIRRVSYEFDEDDPRSVEITVVLTKFVKVTEYRQLTVITDITGIEEENIVEELLRIDDVIGEDTVTTVVSGIIDLDDFPEKPPIERVLNATAEIVSTNADITEDGVIIDGEIEAGAIYVAEIPEQPVHFVHDSFQFSEVLEVAGALPEMFVYTNAVIKRVSYNFNEEDNEIEVNITINFFAKVTEPKQVRVVTDIISDLVEVERELLRVEDVVGEDIVYETVTGRINVPADKPDIERILEANAMVMDVNSFTETDGVMIEGTIEGSILYVGIVEEGPQQPVHYTEQNINFDNFVEIPGAKEDMNTHVEVTVQRVSFEKINDRTAEITVVLSKFAKVTEFRQLEIITDLVVVSPAVKDECPPSYIVYVVQAGDTLWKISRRYHTTVEALLNANPDIDPNNLQIGDKICIPDRIIDPKG